MQQNIKKTQKNKYKYNQQQVQRDVT